LFKKNLQFKKQKQNINFDFVSLDNQKPPKCPEVFDHLMKYNESKEEKFSRFARSICRCVQACSLCSRGDSIKVIDNYEFDPHCPNSVWYSDIVLLTFEPTLNDVRSQRLFYDLTNIIQEYDLKMSDFYCTSVLKCYSNVFHDTNGCPFIKLELESMKNKKLLISFDELSSNYLGFTHNPGSFSCNEFFNVFMVNGINDIVNLDKILRLIKLSKSNQQVSSRLFA
jgi:hypothetical protein